MYTAKCAKYKMQDKLSGSRVVSPRLIETFMASPLVSDCVLMCHTDPRRLTPEIQPATQEQIPSGYLRDIPA